MYAARYEFSIRPRTPMVVAMETRTVSTMRVERESRTMPMKGIAARPPRGSAMSKKVLIRTESV